MSAPGRAAALGLAALVLGSCTNMTAVTVANMVERLPPDLAVEGVLLFETDYVSCTFAALRIAPGFTPDPRAVRATYAALTRLDPDGRDRRLGFPAGGVAVFPGRSATEVSRDLAGVGDRWVAEAVEHTIWMAANCWDDYIADTTADDWETGKFWSLASDARGLVLLGEERPHTLVMVFPDRQRAFYLGP